ncbi:MAG: FKBP-type peptidyl-prolyl cis-trans isomerase [Gammaproteobacteria bacterium]|nr:FKBP-type peptidyl-prolyl cis-trans isomerase [Gammaproteobacteria bacterium]
MSRSRIPAAALTAAVLLVTACQQQAKEPEVPAMTEDQKAIYAYGAAVGQQIGSQAEQLQLNAEELAVFQRAFSDALQDKTLAVKVEQYQEKFQTLAQARIEAAAKDRAAKGEEFLAAAAKEEGAVRTESGLVYRTITPGTGASPGATDTVKVHYHGTLPDGKVFDSSVERNQPAEFPLNRVISCWTEGVQKMKVGEKAKLTCPAAIAYGDRGAGADIAPGATLVFEIDLLGIQGK